jgi:hypothetical protein
LKKFGTEVWGMIGTFSAFAFVCAKSGAAPTIATTTRNDVTYRLM